MFVTLRKNARPRFASDTYGVIPVNFDRDDDFTTMILEVTQGVDAGIDAIGFEAKGSALETVVTAIKAETSSGHALRQCIAVTRRGGTVGIPGVYAGFMHAFMIGDPFDKEPAFAMGQTYVQKYLPRLPE